MSVETFADLQQGSPEWLEARAGIITASTMGSLITATGKPANNEKSRTLAAYLAAERITGRPNETYQSQAMLRGQLDEPLARHYYAEAFGPVEEVGFVLRTDADGVRVGWSPDGIVGEHGGIEIKSREPHIHIAHVNADKAPAENMAQIQTALYVSGRDWIDYVSFSSGLPLWPKRVYPDPKWQAAIPAAAQLLEDNITNIIDTFTERTKDCPPTEYINHFEEIVIK